MRPKKSAEERKQTQRLWREKNKEHLRELKRKWYEKNYKDNPEYKAHRKKYAKENLVRMRIRDRNKSVSYTHLTLPTKRIV